MSKLLDERDHVSLRERRHIFHLLSKLAKSAQVFPRSLEITGVQCDLTAPLTEGGFGYIYKGEYKGEAICVKAARLYERGVNTQTLKAHAGELIIWAHVSHPNILSFRGIFLSDEKIPRICIVSPWMENGDLVHYLKKYPESNRLPLVYDIASGLQYLHEHGIVHADLKAKNVLVSGTKRAMLADFGVSLISMTMATTTINPSVGTANWMAPELFIVDNSFANQESDIWAFGCTCYEISSGMMPFHQYKKAPQLINAFMKGVATLLKPEPSNEWDGSKEQIWLLAQKCCVAAPDIRPKVETILASITSWDMPREDSIPTNTPINAKKRHTGPDYDHVLAILKRIQQPDTEGET
ncbi:hypothetical protein NP233_g13059 [Leucocoprinus birnbaumii]|uniref:Protein kinase domain-containing protein n=1 Tax=Leucocoprinus birnbaumii TaxID=56174 RepID=A0AAD5VDC8_9AGAR|nr:hypothetical protein NP233_g13059 [Leucocoprinus birnbaumii]